MKLIIERRLQEWNRQRKPLPLILIGARQTGKTEGTFSSHEGPFYSIEKANEKFATWKEKLLASRM